MDPSKDAPGSSERDGFEALKREELARAQAAVLAQQNTKHAPISLKLPMGPPKYHKKTQSPSPSYEARLGSLEDELKELLPLTQETSSGQPPRVNPDVTSTFYPSGAQQDRIQTHVTPVRIRNKRFSEVLLVSSYRLVDTSENLPFDRSMSLIQVANQIRPRMEGSFFSGDQYLQVLPFLRHLTRISNQSRLSEASLLLIVEDFLQSPAREASRAQAHRVWPEAVYWLLIAFAPKSSLEKAVRSLNLSVQGQTESVKQFGLRLQM
jgi:hypothetical protein